MRNSSKQTKATPYFSLVPDGAKPDTDLDKEHHGAIPSGDEQVLPA